jgi:hypothetical protein
MSGSAARSATIIYAGYYDLPPPSYGNLNPLPSPWVGSPNTTFFGDAAWAVTSEPDVAAVRIENTGPLSITLQAATIGGYTAWDSFIGAGYVIAPGQNVILSQTTTQFFDGSDKGLVASLISLTWDGVPHNFTDTASILHGFSGENETLPWAEIGRVNATPLPAALPLFATGLGLLGLLGWRRKQKNPALAAA